MGLKIAIMGTRGVPNNYGGFEHIAGYLARGLVQKGHEVTVYNSSRHPYQEKEWRGAEIVHCFDPEHLVGMAGQFIYDFNCIRDARKKEYDIILMLGYTSSSVWSFLYPRNAIVINNMDGLEWQRTKYSRLVRLFLKRAERLAVKGSHHHIADSPLIKKYLDEKYGIRCRYLTYGTELYPAQDARVLKEYGVEKRRYFLLIARMEPENNVEMILDGFCKSGSDLKFLVIGNTKNSFGKRLIAKYRKNSRIIFAGAIFNDHTTQSLTAFCSLYFHGHSVGGTNPSLLNAMAADVPVAAHRNPFNHSVLNENGWYFNCPQEVSKLIRGGQHVNEAFIRNNYSTVKAKFSWGMIIDQYEDYFLECYFKKHYGNAIFRIKEKILVH